VGKLQIPSQYHWVPPPSHLPADVDHPHLDDSEDSDSSSHDEYVPETERKKEKSGEATVKGGGGGRKPLPLEAVGGRDYWPPLTPIVTWSEYEEMSEESKGRWRV